MTMAGGPVISDDAGRRRFLMVVGVVALLVVGLLGIRLGASLAGDDDDAGGRRRGKSAGQAVAEAAEGPGEGESSEGSEGSGSPPTSATPEVAVVEPTNLLATNAQPTFDAYGGIFGGSPVKVVEILLYPSYSFISVQSAENAEFVDEYEWRDGELSGPEAVSMTSIDTEELPAKLFDLTEIDPAVIPGVVQQALGQCGGQGLEATHVIVDRFLPFDDRVLIRVYTSIPERGGGGYVQFTPDGTLVEPVCS